MQSVNEEEEEEELLRPNGTYGFLFGPANFNVLTAEGAISFAPLRLPDAEENVRLREANKTLVAVYDEKIAVYDEKIILLKEQNALLHARVEYFERANIDLTFRNTNLYNQVTELMWPKENLFEEKMKKLADENANLHEQIQRFKAHIDSCEDILFDGRPKESIFMNKNN